MVVLVPIPADMFFSLVQARSNLVAPFLTTWKTKNATQSGGQSRTHCPGKSESKSIGRRTGQTFMLIYRKTLDLLRERWIAVMSGEDERKWWTCWSGLSKQWNDRGLFKQLNDLRSSQLNPQTRITPP